MSIKKYKIAILFIVLSAAWSRLSAQDDMVIFIQDEFPVCDTLTAPHQTYPNKDAALANMQEGEFGQIEGNDSMYVKTADNKLVSVGTVLPADFRYENIGKLDENSPYIVFSKPENANLAFDNNSGNYFDNVYRIKDTYEKLNTKYTVPWLAMNPGKTVHLDAKTQGGEIDESTVKFIIPLSGGSTLQLEHTEGFDVQIPGGSAGTTTEIFALATIDGSNKVVGKLKLANYAAKTQKVNLVPVKREGTTIDGEAIEKELNRIYGERLGITFEVEVKEQFGDREDLTFLNDVAQLTDKNFWGNESEQMKQLRLMYHNTQQDNLEENAAYLFVIGGFAQAPTIQGDMPRGKAVGYIFDNGTNFSDGRLVAHELGHGLFALEHTFATGYGVPQGSTNNLMDYVNNDFLASWQWKIINNPGFVWNFLEGDEDAMMKKPSILFSQANELYNKYGYDNMNLGEESAEGHHICLKELDNTFIKVICKNISDLKDLDFRCNDATITFNKPEKLIGDVFNLEIISRGRDIPEGTIVNVFYKEELLGNFYIHVFRELELTGTIYHYGTTISNYNIVEQEANKLLKSAVVKLKIAHSKMRSIADFDNNRNGKLDIYYNVDINSEENDEFYKIQSTIPEEDAIITLDGGFTMSFKVSSTINRGDTEIKVPGVRGFKTSVVYTIYDPKQAGIKEYFYVTEINNNIIKIRTLDENNRPTPENGFVNEYIFNDEPDDPYIFDIEPAGVNTSPVIVTYFSNLIHVTIPHEIFHKKPHKLMDVGDHENNIMNYRNTSNTVINFSMPLRYFELNLVHTVTGIPTGEKQNQWLLINR